jgi:hypothetical protein
MLNERIESDQIKDNEIHGTRMELSGGCIISVGTPEIRRTLGLHSHI